MRKPNFPINVIVIDMVSIFRVAEIQLARVMQEVYVDLISRELPENLNGIFVHRSINSAAEIKIDVPRDPGLYIILSSYDAGKNKCTLEHNGLRAVYRGHAYNRRERVQSHLDNKNYRDEKEKKGQGYWKECMKLGTLF
jgi:hypothetical protein